MEPGMIIINTGNGKGKTTAAIGQVIRSLGQGWKVAIIQLFKSKDFYGEQKILSGLKGLDFYSFAPRHPFCFKETGKKTVIEQCKKAMLRFRKLISGKKRYDLIVLEEFNIALRDGFIKPDVLLEALSNVTENTIIIITGRGAPESLIKAADLVTEMKEIKHPYNKGIPARKGIEF